MHAKRYALAAVLLLAASLAWAADGFMSVQVREGQVRKSAGFLSPVITTLGYGDQVQAAQTDAEWTPVTTEAGKSGYMHTSALTPKTIVLNATAEDVAAAASGEEIALAGKGFNKQVEEEYRASNNALDYNKVDEMETRVVGLDEVRSFLTEGEVRGGAQ